MSEGIFGRRGLGGLVLGGTAAAAAGGLLAATAPRGAAAQSGGGTAGGAPPPPGLGDLSRQTPIEVVVELGTAEGRHAFTPARLVFQTGRLYRLVLRNPSPHPHYFTSEGLAASVWTRKAQLMGRGADGRERIMAEFKGALREIEVYPGFAAEWWFVPVQAGRFADLRCDIRAEDGRTHAEHGMRGEVVIE